MGKRLTTQSTKKERYPMRMHFHFVETPSFADYWTRHLLDNLLDKIFAKVRDSEVATLEETAIRQNSQEEEMTWE